MPAKIVDKPWGKHGIPHVSGPVKYPGFARADYLSKLCFPELRGDKACELLSPSTVEYLESQIRLTDEVDLVILPDKQIATIALDFIPHAKHAKRFWCKENLKAKCIAEGCPKEVVEKIFTLEDSHLLEHNSSITLADIDKICDVIMDYFENILFKHTEEHCNLLIMADPIIVGLLDVGFVPNRDYMAKYHPITTTMPSCSTMFLE